MCVDPAAYTGDEFRVRFLYFGWRATATPAEDPNLCNPPSPPGWDCGVLLAFALLSAPLRRETATGPPLHIPYYLHHHASPPSRVLRFSPSQLPTSTLLPAPCLLHILLVASAMSYLGK